MSDSVAGDSRTAAFVFPHQLFADHPVLREQPAKVWLIEDSLRNIRRMSDWGKGEWSVTWDGLFWRWIHRHRSALIRVGR